MQSFAGFKKLLLCAWLALSIAPFTAQALTEGDYTYTVSGTNATITDFNSAYTGTLSITNVLGGYPVTSIGNSAFSSCAGLTSVTIPDSVTSIDYAAFYYCTALTNVIIGMSVTSIGPQAFYFCTGLTSVTIPDSLTSIGGSAFYRCAGLTSIRIPNNVTSIGVGAFSICTGLTNITIPDSVTSIESSVFYSCTGLTNVIIGTSVASIGYAAFYECTGLTSITIPDRVASIGDKTFYNCTGLTNVIIGTRVASIGKQAFYSCDKLTSIIIDNSVASIGDYAFSNCTGLTNVIIGSSVTSIGGFTFCDCTGLTSVTIPDSVTSIGESAFFICNALTNIIIGTGVASIGDLTFDGCSQLTEITVANENLCYSSTNGILFNKSVTTLIAYPAGKAGSCAVPESVSSIGNYAFRRCEGLTSVTIPDSVTSIGNQSFIGCFGLTSVTIPDSVTNIGNWAFSSCNGLTNLIIGNSVASIGDYAFNSCTLLTSIYFKGDMPATGTGVFGSTPATIYRLYESAGWPPVPDLWAGRPTAYWGPMPTKIIGVSGNLTFGSTTTGTTATATMNITNSGDATLTVTGIAYPDCFSGAWSGTIAAGSQTNVTVTFAPVAVTNYSGIVTVNSDATSGTNTITASGAGIAASVYTKAITGFRLTTANSGTLVSGPAWASGKYGNGLSMSGSQYVSVPTPSSDVFNLTGDMTIALWVKPSTVTCSGADPAYALVSKRSGNSPTPYELYIVNGGSLLFHYWGTNIQWPTFQATGAITTGSWQHIAVTRSFSGANATVTFYINGVEAGHTISATGLTQGSSDPVWLGRDGYHTGYTSEGTYNGVMDEVQMYNRALSAQEISRIMANTSSSITNRVANWRMDESTGTLASDTIADGYINEGAKTVTALVPAGTRVTALIPRITTSPQTTVSPLSGVVQNFSSPVLYTVTAEDLSTQAYTVTVAVPSAFSDADVNGIPDVWELQYFSGIGTNPNVVCSNGVNTVLAAYIAGLNPNDPQSQFIISNFRSLSEGSAFDWNTVPGRLYSIYWTTNLLNSFQPLETNIPWTRSSFTNSAIVPQGFYKISVQMAE